MSGGGDHFYQGRRPRWMLRMWLWTAATGAGITLLAGVMWYATDLLVEYESARLGYALVVVFTLAAYGRINAWMTWPTAWDRGYDEGVYEGCQRGIAAYQRHNNSNNGGRPAHRPAAGGHYEETTIPGWWS